MKRHQVHTGAVNPGNHCFSVGSIASFTFWAYGSGCDLVILGVDLKPIHIIPGHSQGNKLIVALECGHLCGKIAVSHGSSVVIYQPKLRNNDVNLKDETPVFTWVVESEIKVAESDGQATILSWSSNGEKLLVGCGDILLYCPKKAVSPVKKKTHVKVHFSIDEMDEIEEEPGENTGNKNVRPEWELVWRSGINEHPRELKFSPDGELFASVGFNDTIIKVWHERLILPTFVEQEKSSQRNHSQPTPDYTFFYLVHPKPVVGFSWRKTVPLLPPGSVSNILISSCCDNMCRIWSETVTPDEDIIKFSTFSDTPSKRNVPKDTATKTFAANVKKSASAPAFNERKHFPLNQLNSSPSPSQSKAKKSKRFRHFHISATINPQSDIPLLPSISSFDSSKHGSDTDCTASFFTVHWLDNKYHQAMALLNKLLQDAMEEKKPEHSEFNKHLGPLDEIANSSNGMDTSNESVQSPRHHSFVQMRPNHFKSDIPVWDSSKPESIDTFLSCLSSPVSPEVQEDLGLSFPSSISEELLRSWCKQSDALFAIHPSDGSLLIWHVNYLGEKNVGSIRQPQVSFSSRIPMAIPSRDAATLCSRLLLYANHYSDYLSLNKYPSSKSEDISASSSSIQLDTKLYNDLYCNEDNCNMIGTDCGTGATVNVLSKHSDGSLNQWEMAFSPNSSYSVVSSIKHVSRFCGHRYHLSGIICHPTLPLLLTTAHHNKKNINQNGISSNPAEDTHSVNSELILWRVDPVGALLHSGGVTELTRLNGDLLHDFEKVAWFPILFPSWCLGSDNISSSTCLVSLNGGQITIYQAVVNAAKMLVEINESPNESSSSIGHVVSQQSSAHPGCLLQLASVDFKQQINSDEVLLFTVIREDQIKSTKKKNPESARKKHRIVSESFFLLLLIQSKSSGALLIHSWKILFYADQNSLAKVKTRRNTVQPLTDSSDEESFEDESTTSEPNMCPTLSILKVTIFEITAESINLPLNTNIVNVFSAIDPLSFSLTNHMQHLPFTVAATLSNGKIHFLEATKTDDAEILSFSWSPWQGSSTVKKDRDAKDVFGTESSIHLKGIPLVVKPAHCGMIACLCLCNLNDPETKQDYLAVVLTVFECLSTGGAKWLVQDRIEILRFSVANVMPITPKVTERFQLDWLSCEDGSFLLAVCIGFAVKVFSLVPVGLVWEKQASLTYANTSISENIGKGNVPSYKQAKPPLIKRQSTLDVVTNRKLFGPYHDKFLPGNKTYSSSHLKWSQLTEIALNNKLDLEGITLDQIVQSEPLMISWVRDGLLIAATETEMNVFCHWLENGLTTKEISMGILHGDASLKNSKPSGLFQHLCEQQSKPFDFLNIETSVVSAVGLPDTLCPTLPQYHPLVLTELMNGGHLVAVKTILIEMARLMNNENRPEDDHIIHEEPIKLSKFDLASEEESSMSGTTITPVLLYNLLSHNGRIDDVQKCLSNPPVTQTKDTHPPGKAALAVSPTGDDAYDELFNEDESSKEDTLDDFLEDSKPKPKSSVVHLLSFPVGYFGPEHCQVMHNYLEHNLLPGLNSLDQMELMALADTISHGHIKQSSQESNKCTLEAGGSVMGGGRGYATSGDDTTAGSLDKCGLRYVLAVHNHLCLLRSLPAPQGAKLLRRGLETCQFAWAYHSDVQEEILSVIPSVLRGSPEWEELRSFGVGWWIRSTDTLRRLIEQTARAAFQKNSNPLEAAVYYMALNKKNVIRGLFKSVRDTRMADFFKNNFTEDRWRKAALKNAFALMGKQRFQEAVAFFLLANSVNDALEVCIDKLSDFQLASIIVRLYGNDLDNSAYSDMLKKYVLEDDTSTFSDPFIKSMAHWTIGNYSEALQVLMVPALNLNSSSNIPIKITDVFNFYNYLRTHPMLIKQRKIEQKKDIGSTAEQDGDDSITPKERQLFFATSKTHLDAGCPLLALDVLSRLPPVKLPALNSTQSDVQSEKIVESSASVDWGTPADNSIAEKNEEDELELDWSDDEDEDDASDDSKSEEAPVQTDEKPPKPEATEKSDTKEDSTLPPDVFTQQLRLMACMKIFVVELKAISKAFSSNGGQLRQQLYLWLEKETKVLHSICHGDESCDIDISCMPSLDVTREFHQFDDDVAVSSDSDTDHHSSSKYVPSLHELIIADKQDWKLKRDSTSHRRKWLKRYQHFLRTLLSYCGLHDDAKGSLATVRMELLLLLQESLQEKNPHQQLTSPLPPPTTVPLLSSSVVSCQTVVADPSSRLKHMINDIFTAVLTFSEPPLQFKCQQLNLFTQSLCNQAAALSSCVYQSLCDTHTKTFRHRILDGEVDLEDSHGHIKTSPGHHTLHPTVGNHNSRPRSISSCDTAYVAPNTLPSQWPGVASLQSLLNNETTSGDNARQLIVLLCESLVSVYVTLLIRGIYSCNTKLLFRLVTHTLNKTMWNAVFGGGARLVVKYSKPVHDSPRDGTSKIREKLNRRVLSYSGERKGSFASTDTTSYSEKFVAPEISLWDWFLSKPLEVKPKNGDDVYDSDSSDSSQSDASSDSDNFTFNDSDEEDQTDDPFRYYESKKENSETETEHGNPMSYSWHLIRLAVVRVVIHNLKEFLPSCGLELNELGTSAPALNSVLHTLYQWQSFLQYCVSEFVEVPQSFIEVYDSNNHISRPATLKHQALFDVTPFSNDKECRAIKRLWNCLVRSEILQNMFIHFIFEKNFDKKTSADVTDKQSFDSSVKVTVDDNFTNGMKKTPINNASSPGRVKVLHKENEILTSFCINHTNPNIVVVSTAHDLLEIDLTSILTSDSWSWVEEDLPPPTSSPAEPNTRKDEDFLFVSRRSTLPANTLAPPIYAPFSMTTQTGQGGNIVLKRQNSSARRMTSHPNLPYYLTGHHDGSVRMWEWGHQQQISLFTSTRHQPKVTNVHFTPYGNKVATVDIDGYLTMWQVSSPRKPFLLHQCHDRTTSDCCFIASSSVVATTGLSSIHRNLAVWDTLLPKRSMLIHDFIFWDNVGASCVRHVPQYQSLIVGGRDGRLCAFDMRRMVEPVCSFVAHDTAIKCMSISPDQRYYVTGSVGGDMRVWDTQSHSLIYSLNGEHPRASLFRNFGAGTMQISIAEPGHQVFSCGADGTLKLRMLPDTNNLGNMLGDPLGGKYQKLALQRQVIKLAESVREQCMVY